MFARFLQNSGLIVVSLGLLFGGVMLFGSGVPFWSILYGSTAVGLGILTALITFTEMTKPLYKKGEGVHYIACRVCHKQTLAPYLIDKIICPDCQYAMAIKLNIAVMAFFVVIGIPVSSHVLSLKQTITQQAHEPRVCDPGVWRPISCQCGYWDATAVGCAPGEAHRICQGSSFCCIEHKIGQWDCRQS